MPSSYVLGWKQEENVSKQKKEYKSEKKIKILKELVSKLAWVTSVFLGPRPESSKLVTDAGKTKWYSSNLFPDLLLVRHFTLRKSFSSGNENILWRSLGIAYLVLNTLYYSFMVFYRGFFIPFPSIFIEI